MFLSMIIPVYNTEKYLEECLNSCLSQDLPCTDYEIICVNDGSKDRSLEILCEYQTRHESIIVIDQPNAGVSATRNAGLEIARGNYVWFIDADDFIRENCLKRLQDCVNETDCDRLTFSNLYFFTDKLSDRERQQLADGTLLTKRPIFDIDVRSERQDPYTRYSYNETLKELYRMGVFDPANAAAAKILLDGMDFPGVDRLRQQIGRLLREGEGASDSAAGEGELAPAPCPDQAKGMREAQRLREEAESRCVV